jgi:hypothetical protein
MTLSLPGCLCLAFLTCGLTLTSAASDAPKTHAIPLGGNAFFTQSGTDADSDLHHWSDPRSILSIYFRVDRPASLKLVLREKVPGGASRIRATVAGQTFEKDLTNPALEDIPLAAVSAKEPGYLRVDLQGLKRTGGVFAEIDSLEVLTSADLAFVPDNQKNRFYWGRRGPSVHLGYDLPADDPTEFFYNEVTVPSGSDPIGSYFMANGFGEGYFGMQVNSATERRILFSVWSPFSTDHPQTIPEDQKIVLLKKGAEVHGGEFGGEGSGGQSYWLYPWKPGVTYRFLNRVHPDGSGATVYTAWFFDPETKAWKLIASFKRPHTDKHLTGAHSFLENFSDIRGYLGRAAEYGNQWTCDTGGKWHEITTAHFSGDDIAQRGQRLDYAGGTRGNAFFLRNGGFFASPVTLGSSFTRMSSGGSPPAIDFKTLEGLE